MQNCISEVKLWMDCNKLKLNDDKTESILIKSDRIMLPDSAPTSIRVGNSDILFVTHARNLGITISSNTTMEKHVTCTFKLHENVIQYGLVHLNSNRQQRKTNR